MLRIDDNEINLEALAPGDTIPTAILESLFGEQDGTDKFRLRCLSLCAAIRNHFQRDGRAISVRTRKGPDGHYVSILDRDEQSMYARHDFNYAIRRMRRRHDETTDVLGSELPRDMRDAHEFDIIRQGRILQELDRTEKRVRRYGPQKRVLDTAADDKNSASDAG